MGHHPAAPHQDPAEGSREVVERELKRKGGEPQPEKQPPERASEGRASAWQPRSRAVPSRRRDSSRHR